MNLPALCIHRPVMTTLLMLGVVFFGIMAYLAMPVSE
ncbi:MAG: efflux RND transporter permease subunit, partial [Magnetococcales bacterium]|nr:efflux RND transporter permease subunit [Magnetococcales bacterium]